MLYKSSFETAAQSEMVAALFELYLALMRDVKKGIFYSVLYKGAQKGVYESAQNFMRNPVF